MKEKPNLTPQQIALQKIEKYGTAIEILPTWKRIPFIKSEYWITPEAEVISNSRGILKKIKIREEPPRGTLTVSLYERKSKRSYASMSLARLLFFCFKYPDVLGKPLENMSYKEYQNMPIIDFKDNNHHNLKLSNLWLRLISSRNNKRAQLSLHFPELISRSRTALTIKEEKQVIKLLLSGKVASEIIEQLSLSITPQSINRTARRNGFVYKRTTGWEKKRT